MPDPQRTLDLLWRRTAPEAPARRGPKQGRSVDELIDTAVELADAEGLDAVSMRRVAQALGVVPMTLYTYVPDKSTLLDLMLDHVYLCMTRADFAGQPWRRRLVAVAEDNRKLYVQHPWAAELSRGRPPLGPGQMTKYEHELRAFDGLGLDELETDAALTYLLGFVQASARAAADAHAAVRDSAQTDAQWWEVNGPLLEQVFDAAAYPTAARIGAVAGEALGAAYNPCHAYQFGLERVLDGLGVLIEQRAGQ